MRYLRTLFKSSRGLDKYSTLFILTTVFGLLYLIQMTYLNKFMKISYTREVEHEDNINAGISSIPYYKFEGEQLVHFDFKGAPPKISYLMDFIPFVKRLGATGVMLEYEDMFPYSGELEGIAAKNAYTASDIAKIDETVRQNNLTIIPFVPTFSHFEFVLKLQEFKHFREIDDLPHVLCPSHDKVYPFLYKMIDQVIAVHPTVRYLHIGSDKANTIGMCAKCQNLIKKNKWRRDDLYFEHVKKLAQYITNTYPEVRPIIWGDKIVVHNEKSIIYNRIPDLVDVMLGNYNAEKGFPRHNEMKGLAKLFKNIWITSAFKGAKGNPQVITSPDYSFRDIKAWTYFAGKWKSRVNFKGIVLTGWQRYDHFSVLCELLPVGVPSLALSLQYLNKKLDLNFDSVRQALRCNDFVPLNFEDIQNLGLLTRLKCDYPGFKIYKIIHFFHNIMYEAKVLLRKFDSRDMLFYSVTHNISNPAFIHKMNINLYKKFLIKFIKIENEIRAALSEVYDQHTVNEWILTYSTPLRLRLEAAINIMNTLKSRNVWPRRPLADFAPRLQHFFNQTCSKTETLGCTLFNIH